MSLSLKIIFLAAIVFYFISVYVLLRKKTLLLKYTLLWILAGIVMTLVVIFPEIIVCFTRFLGIETVTNCLFAMCIFFVILILMSITAIVSKMNEKNKKLVQNCGNLEKRIRELEQQLHKINEVEGRR